MKLFFTATASLIIGIIAGVFIWHHFDSNSKSLGNLPEQMSAVDNLEFDESLFDIVDGRVHIIKDAELTNEELIQSFDLSKRLDEAKHLDKIAANKEPIDQTLAFAEAGAEAFDREQEQLATLTESQRQWINKAQIQMSHLTWAEPFYLSAAIFLLEDAEGMLEKTDTTRKDIHKLVAKACVKQTKPHVQKLKEILDANIKALVADCQSTQNKELLTSLQKHAENAHKELGRVLSKELLSNSTALENLQSARGELDQVTTFLDGATADDCFQITLENAQIATNNAWRILNPPVE